MLNFRDAVKALNSEWEVGEVEYAMDKDGNKYERVYIIGNPTRIDCLAIAQYFGVKYSNGYFYFKI